MLPNGYQAALKEKKKRYNYVRIRVYRITEVSIPKTADGQVEKEAVGTLKIGMCARKEWDGRTLKG